MQITHFFCTTFAKDNKFGVVRKELFSLLVCLTLGFYLSGQVGTVRGNVFEKFSGNPLIQCNIIISELNLGTSTDANGFYTLSNIPLGEYILTASYVGYDTLSYSVKIQPSSIVFQSFILTESSITLSEVAISATSQRARNTVNISQISASSKQIKALPSIGGEADILQYLQVLPGIVSTGDQGGQLYIRGGTPIQNKILLDGLNIFNPFHSVGFYSVFETEIIKSTDVFTGGFGAEYGGRISAIVDIKTREGNKNRMSGFVSGGPFMAKAMFEGPLKKLKSSGSSISYVFTGKKSIIDQTSKTLYSYASKNDTIGLPFDFSDFYGKMTFNSSGGSKVSFFGFGFNDSYNNIDVASIDWKNVGGGTNFVLIPAGSDILIDGLVGYTSYKVGIAPQNDEIRNSKINEISANINFSLFGQNNEIKYGLELRSLTTDFEFVNPFGIRIQQEQNTSELGVYAKYRHKFNAIIVEPSFRSQYYSSLGTITFEPRLGAKVIVSDALRIKMAAGIYTQNLLSTSNERDVVNLFNGFLTGPESIVNNFDGQRLSNKLQKSQHLILGLEYDITKRVQLQVEGYYKNFPQLIVVNRNKIERGQPDYAKETGKAYGIDFTAKYDYKKFYFWGTYSHGYVKRFDGNQEYPTIFDRRHNINFLATYTPSKNAGWLISCRWNMGSGFPFTQTKGFYNNLDYLGGVGTDYQTLNPDQIGILYSDVRNGGRLPYYHRLDLSIQKKFNISKYNSIELNLSVTNAYDRANIFYFDRLAYLRVDQLPILPTLSIKINM